MAAMVDMNMVFHVGGLLLAEPAGLLHHAPLQVHLGHVQPQVEVGVGGVAAVAAHLVLHPPVDPLHMLHHLLPTDESLVTF